MLRVSPLSLSQSEARLRALCNGEGSQTEEIFGAEKCSDVFLALPCTVQCPCVLGMGSKFLQMMILCLSKRVLEFAVRSLDERVLALHSYNHSVHTTVHSFCLNVWHSLKHAAAQEMIS